MMFHRRRARKIAQTAYIAGLQAGLRTANAWDDTMATDWWADKLERIALEAGADEGTRIRRADWKMTLDIAFEIPPSVLADCYAAADLA